MRLLAVALAAVLLPFDSSPAAAQSVVPRPVVLSARPGRFTLTARTTISTDRASEPLAYQLAHDLEPATGFRLRVVVAPSAAPGAIDLRRDASLTRLGHEGYTLGVRASGITARALDDPGLFYAIQTLRQLLPPEIFREAAVAGVAWVVDGVSVEDTPRFTWRGGHLDVGRHFMPKEFVKKYVDLLALHKLNSLHLHLTDDQGWRIEIAKYPKLTALGAWRKETL